jgi:hypothetical protein
MLKGTQEKYILKARCDCKYEVTYVHRPDYPFASSYSNEAALRNERDGGAGAARARTVSDCIIGFQKLRDRLGDEFDEILEVPTKAMRYLPDMDPERKWTIDIVEEALETMRPTAQPPTPDPQPEPPIHYAPVSALANMVRNWLIKTGRSAAQLRADGKVSQSMWHLGQHLTEINTRWRDDDLWQAIEQVAGRRGGGSPGR